MADTQQSTATPSSETWIGIVFWVAIIAVVAFVYFKEDRAVVLLDVSTQQDLVSGMVTFAGAPVRGGVVHVVVSKAGNKHYLAGTTLPVSEDGKFTSQEGQLALRIAKKRGPLYFSAVFRGTLVEKDDSKVKPLSGEATLYLNSSPPLGERFLWCLAIAATLLLAFLLVLFTGDLGHTKARWLFMLMYFSTFLSLALPIVVSLVVAQNPYLVASMEASPIGLVNAQTKVLSEPQWLINIGGTVKPAPASDSTDEAGTKIEAAAVAGADSDQPVKKIVEGGVAVPFYVVLLAMFGAGINMTLKVPEIQRSYEDVLPEARSSLWLNPIAATLRLVRGQTEAPAVVSRKTAGDIRWDLIENYMYLLSAPFLAIAMYYLLQVLAEQVTQSVLVLMAFATGLSSKAVIKGIIDFAEGTLKRRQGGPSAQPSAEVAEKAAEAKASRGEAEAAVRALDEARARQTAADAAAKAAEDAAHKAELKQVAVEAAVGGGGATQAQAEIAKEEAEKAAREAAAKQAEAAKAGEAVAKAAQETEAKEAEARAAASAAREAEAKQAAAQTAAAASAVQEAEGKQAEARAAVEATEEAAQEATEKQAEAGAAVKAAVQPAQAAAQEAEAKAKEAEAEAAANAAREATPPRPDAATDATKKD